MKDHVIIAKPELRKKILEKYGSVSSCARRMKLNSQYPQRSYIAHVVNQLTTVSEKRAKAFARELGGEAETYFYEIPTGEWRVRQIARLSKRGIA